MFTVKLGKDRTWPYAIQEDGQDYNAGNALYDIRRDHAGAEIAPEVVTAVLVRALQEAQAVADLVTPAILAGVERALYGAPPASPQAVTLAVGATQVTLMPGMEEGLVLLTTPRARWAQVLTTHPDNWTAEDWSVVRAEFAAQVPHPAYPLLNPEWASLSMIGGDILIRCGDAGARWQWGIEGGTGRFYLAQSPYNVEYLGTLQLNPDGWTPGEWALVAGEWAAQHPHPRRTFSNPRVYQQDEHCIVFVCGDDAATWTWEVNRESGQFYE